MSTNLRSILITILALSLSLVATARAADPRPTGPASGASPQTAGQIKQPGASAGIAREMVPLPRPEEAAQSSAHDGQAGNIAPASHSQSNSPQLLGSGSASNPARPGPGPNPGPGMRNKTGAVQLGPIQEPPLPQPVTRSQAGKHAEATRPQPGGPGPTPTPALRNPGAKAGIAREMVPLPRSDAQINPDNGLKLR